MASIGIERKKKQFEMKKNKQKLHVFTGSYDYRVLITNEEGLTCISCCHFTITNESVTCVI